jgi:hypothetical protein
MIEGWPLEAICLHLEALTFGDIPSNRLLMNVPPGFMKSLLVNVFWPAWEWGPCDLAHMRYIAFSYSDEITTRDNNKMVRLIQSPTYQQLWGDRFKMTKTGERRLENNKTGFKLATSVGGVSTGEPGDRVLLDDPHNVIKAESDTEREKTVRFVRESMSNRLNALSALRLRLPRLVVIAVLHHRNRLLNSALPDPRASPQPHVLTQSKRLMESIFLQRRFWQ